MAEPTIIMDPVRVEHKLQRIARQIREKHFSEKELMIIGIRHDGEHVAKRLRDILEGMEAFRIIPASIGIDKQAPVSSDPDPSFDPTELDERAVVLVDDVVNSGRTLAHTTKALLERPLSSLTTVALVDREHHRFPIRADLVGTTLATTMKQHIELEAKEGEEYVYLQ